MQVRLRDDRAVRIDLKPVESVVFRSGIVAIGTFRCPASDPLFNDSGPCTHHTFVFPRTSTTIRHSGGAPFTATPNCVTLYNQHQEYRRTTISAADASDWYVVDESVLAAALDTDTDRPFRRTHVPIDSRTYLEQRRLFDAVSRGAMDEAEVEERVLRLLDRVIAVPVPRVTASQRDRVEAVKALIAAAPARLLSLRALAEATGWSPFHLCRAFRAVTGMSITGYRHELRLRVALGRLEHKRDGLSDLALQLGYSTHSHFTAAFRRHFGITPSQYRRA